MNEENIKKEDYIALPPLKKIAVQFLHFCFSITDQLFDVARKSMLLIVVGIMAGLLSGFAIYSSKMPYYRVSMIAQSSFIHRPPLAELIKSLNNLIISRSYDKLASELGISEQDAKQLNHLEMTGLQDESVAGDTSSKYNLPFKISANIIKTELADTFQHALVGYLNNKPLLKMVREEQITYNNEKLIFIDKELEKLDTLKTAYNRFFASGKIITTYSNSTVEPANTYKQANDLFNEKGSILAWQASNKDLLQVVDAFKGPALPHSTSRFLCMLFGALMGLGVAYLIALYRVLHKKTMKYQERI